MRNRSRVEELNTTPLKKKRPARAFFSLSLFIWSALDVCRMSHRILLHLGRTDGDEEPLSGQVDGDGGGIKEADR